MRRVHQEGDARKSDHVDEGDQSPMIFFSDRSEERIIAVEERTDVIKIEIFVGDVFVRNEIRALRDGDHDEENWDRREEGAKRKTISIIHRDEDPERHLRAMVEHRVDIPDEGVAKDAFRDGDHDKRSRKEGIAREKNHRRVSHFSFF